LARRKPASRKMHLSKAGKRSEAVPSWVVAKTRGRFRIGSKRRNWRRGKLKI
jgi:large subunit ribosomal protein L39e